MSDSDRLRPPHVEPSVRIYASNSNKYMIDITEGVQTLYDHVLASLDWSSGFFDFEEVEAIAHLAETCGFDATEARNEIEKRIQERRRDECYATHLVTRVIRPKGADGLCANCDMTTYNEWSSTPCPRLRSFTTINIVPCPHGSVAEFHHYCLREHPDCPGPTMEFT